MLLGEVHGAAANVRAVRAFVRRLHVCAVGFELPVSWQGALQAYAVGHRRQLRERLRREPWVVEAGVLSREHLALLSWLGSHRVVVLALRVEGKNWNSSERSTSQRVMRLVRRHGHLIAMVGNLHARHRPFSGLKIGLTNQAVPLGYLLKKHSITVRLRYARGSAWNFKRLNFRDATALQTLGHRRALLKPAASQYFDYDYIQKNTKAITLP